MFQGDYNIKKKKFNAGKLGWWLESNNSSIGYKRSNQMVSI